MLNRGRKMKKWCSVLALLLLLSGRGADEAKKPELMEPVGVKSDIVQVEKDTFFETDYYEGRVIPHAEELSFSSDGKISRIAVLPGQEVKKGEVLAELDQTGEQEQAEAAEQELTAQRQAAQSQNRVLSAQIGIAEGELRKLQGENASETEQNLQKLKIEELRTQLKQQQETQRLEEERLAERLSKLRQELGGNQILAPFDGKVIYLLPQCVKGSWVQKEQPVLYLADESRLLVESKLAPAFEVENAHRVYARVGSQEFGVTYLPLTSQDYLDATISEVELKSRFQFSGSTEGLESGDGAIICVVSKYRESALTVPVNAVYKGSGGSSYVYRVDKDGKRERVTVETGISTEARIEILEGLSGGDSVYVKD